MRNVFLPYLNYVFDYDFNDNLGAVNTLHKDLCILNLTVLIFQYFTGNIYVDYFYLSETVDFIHDLVMSGLVYHYIDLFFASLDDVELDDYTNLPFSQVMSGSAKVDVPSDAVLSKDKGVESSSTDGESHADNNARTDVVEGSSVTSVSTAEALNSLDVEGDYSMYMCEDTEVFDGYHINYDTALRYDSIVYKRSLRRFRELHYLRSMRAVLEQMSSCFSNRLLYQKNLAFLYSKKDYYISHRFLFFKERRDFLFKIILQNVFKNCFYFFFLFKSTLVFKAHSCMQLQLKNRLYCDLSSLDSKHGDIGKVFDTLNALYCADFFRKEGKYRLQVSPIAQIRDNSLSLINTDLRFDYCFEYLDIFDTCTTSVYSFLVEYYRILYLLFLYGLTS